MLTQVGRGCCVNQERIEQLLWRCYGSYDRVHNMSAIVLAAFVHGTVHIVDLLAPVYIHCT